MRSVKSFDNAAVPFCIDGKYLYVNSGGNVMTAKIIKADAGSVTLGYEDGSFEDVPCTELPFGPEVVKVGTVLDVYQNGEQRMYTVSKSAGEAKGKRKVNTFFVQSSWVVLAFINSSQGGGFLALFISCSAGHSSLHLSL